MEPTLGRFEMEKFTGKEDFGMWKYKLLGQLEIQGLASVLDEDFSIESTSEKQEEGSDPRKDPKKAAMDLRVRNLLGTCLSDVILRKVMDKPTSLEMWRALEDEYQAQLLPNRIYLKQQFASFKMEEDKSIEANLDVFLKLISDLASLKITISDEDQAIQLLTSLPPAYEPLVHTLKYGNGKETLTVREVKASAYAKEAELRHKGLLKKTKSNSEGLYVESRGRSNKRSDKGDGNQKGKSKSRSKYKNKNGKGNKGTCFICGKEGHWKRECPNRGKRQSEESSANTVAEVKEPLVLTASQHNRKDEWILDSGCTFHICPNKELMFDIKEFDGGKVSMANNTYSKVKGIGKIKITNPDGSVVILTEVRYMPDMGRNLISFGMLEKSGCNYRGEDYTVTFYKDGQKVISGNYIDGLYYLQGKVSNGEVNVAEMKDAMTKLWHSRLGHMSAKNMEVLAKEGFLPLGEVGKLDFCESCVLGKSHKQSFPKAKHTTTRILEYVHSDLWGSPSTPASLAGNKYFISFIDDYSKKVWTYFLRTKDEAFMMFKEWKETVENHTEKKIKCLRTDNGLEFCNHLFDELCQSSGIKRHRTCTYTPQQNGVSERMNRTIMDKVRSMLAETGLGQEFWAEATSTAVYLINRTPNSTIGFQLPEERWTGQKPDLSNLKRFGCTAYVHVVQEKTSPRTIKGVFVGYPFGVKGYRVWIPEEGKCTTSRNVVFREEEVYKDTLIDTPNAPTSSNGETKKKSGRKTVTFDTEMIHGPSTSGSKVTETPFFSPVQSTQTISSDESSSQGGDSSSQGGDNYAPSSEPSSSSSSSDSDDSDDEGLSFGEED
ncbi:unnamed protein product [Microthlaspi erraticum]|uniref:Integrase catalytic domain-containing protein n=1 Tax=Microthlaspi erraticum TaxID=1685480 RepID=A0A6D2JA63_9BRAS|nr:unnamed protein product [Microthlaspi erraticum]CAA7042498.1 unnamed protein product [Microthlaspi erraticum]